MRTITLTEEEHDNLLLMMGFALGEAVKRGEFSLARRLTVLINAIEKDNPDFIPYTFDPEKGPQRVPTQ